MTVYQGTLSVYDAAGHRSNTANYGFDFLPAAQPSRFPGDPGPGKVYSGCSVWPGTVTNPPPGGDAHLWLSNATGKVHALRREYSDIGNSFNWSQIDSALNKGQLPLHTCKFNSYSPAQIVAGAMDAQLLIQVNNAKAAQRAGKAIWLGYYHEPEDNFTTAASAAEFRAAFRYIVMYFRSHGVTNVAWNAPMWMTDWTFGASGRKAWWWDPDWKGTLSGGGGTRPSAADWYTGSQAVIDILSFDQYSPTIGATTYRTFTSNFDTMHNALLLWERPMKPYVIGEIGTKSYSIPGSTWATHWQGVMNYCMQYDIIGVAYYNTHLNNFMDEPNGARFNAYKSWVLDSRVLSASQVVF